MGNALNVDMVNVHIQQLDNICVDVSRYKELFSKVVISVQCTNITFVSVKARLSAEKQQMSSESYTVKSFYMVSLFHYVNGRSLLSLSLSSRVKLASTQVSVLINYRSITFITVNKIRSLHNKWGNA